MFRDATGAPISVATSRVPVVDTHVVASQGGTAAAPVASQGGTAAVAVASQGGSVAAAGAGQEAAVLLALMGGRGGWSLDALVDASGLGVGAVQGALLGLELDGLVSFDALGSYAPSTAPGPHPL